MDRPSKQHKADSDQPNVRKPRIDSSFNRFRASMTDRYQAKNRKYCGHAGQLKINGVPLCCAGSHGAACKTETLEYLVTIPIPRMCETIDAQTWEIEELHNRVKYLEKALEDASYIQSKILDTVSKPSTIITHNTTNKTDRSTNSTTINTTHNDNSVNYTHIDIGILAASSTDIAKAGLYPRRSDGLDIYYTAFSVLKRQIDSPSRNQMLQLGNSANPRDRLIFKDRVVDALRENPNNLDKQEASQLEALLDTAHADLEKEAETILAREVELEKQVAQSNPPGLDIQKID